MSTIPERLAMLRSRMRETGVDAYLIPTEDFHGSEYVGDYFACRKFITGFTGSAGTAVILQEQACLWTDGRYFLQAARQLEGSGITLQKMREEGVPTVEQFLADTLKAGQTVGCDGRTLTAAGAEKLEKVLSERQISLAGQMDLIGDIWGDRPAMSASPVFELAECYTGRSRADKLQALREKLSTYDADCHLLTSLDDIAWLLNLRGNDVECNPVFLSYFLMTPAGTSLYIQECALSGDIAQALAADGITVLPYGQIYQDITKLPADSRLLMDPARVNYSLLKLIPSGVKMIRAQNPTTLMKACKNAVETANMIQAHIKDGVAVTRFIYWLKHNVGKADCSMAGSGTADRSIPADSTDRNIPDDDTDRNISDDGSDRSPHGGTAAEGPITEITELSAAEKLEEFRAMGEHYMGPSFTPIIAYAEHGAIIHYSATPETDVPLKPAHMLLADTGGQYLEGTTDITRTIVLGETTQQEKEYFTRVLRGNLNLAAAHFLYGCAGRSFDYLAREPLWEIGEDYNHGTGHGVGYFLNVHEGPNSFHYRVTPGVTRDYPLEEGMITSDEPGYYRPGAFGIRHENLILCEKAEKTACGQFMKFRTITLVPFDLEAVLPDQMTEKERALLNAYHKEVYEKISPFLPEEEKEWLKEATREI